MALERSRACCGGASTNSMSTVYQWTLAAAVAVILFAAAGSYDAVTRDARFVGVPWHRRALIAIRRFARLSNRSDS